MACKSLLFILFFQSVQGSIAVIILAETRAFDYCERNWLSVNLSIDCFHAGRAAGQRSKRSQHRLQRFAKFQRSVASSPSHLNEGRDFDRSCLIEIQVQGARPAS